MSLVGCTDLASSANRLTSRCPKLCIAILFSEAREYSSNCKTALSVVTLRWAYKQLVTRDLCRLQNTTVPPHGDCNTTSENLFVSYKSCASTCLLSLWLLVFSERELMFMFAICRRPTVCLSVCRLSSVTFVHPTQAIEIFGNVLRHLVPWPSVTLR